MDSESDSAVLWERRFTDLRAWKDNHGDCNVPKAEGKLGRWVVRQRELRKKGKLEGARAARLDALGFVWNTNEAAWEHKYALLVKYNERHRHCCVPISDATLGMWVAKMRANRRRDKLAQHRIDKLNALNFVWNTAEADWMDKYARLRAFRVTNGHSCVPFNEGELGWWVNTQRQNKRKGKLAAHREQLLNEAAFVWNPQQFLAARRRHAAAARASAHLPHPQYYRQPHSLYPVPSPPPQLSYAQHAMTASAHVPETNPQKRRQPSYYSPPVEDTHPLAPASLSPVSVKRVKLLSPGAPSTYSAWSHMHMSHSVSPRTNSDKSSMRWGAYYAPSGLSSAPSVLHSVHNHVSLQRKPASNVASDGNPETIRRQTTKATSIASLLAPIPKKPSPVAVKKTAECNDEEELAKLNEGEGCGGLEVLSSICGMPMVNSLNVNSLTGAAVKSATNEVMRRTSVSSSLSLPPISSLRMFEATASSAGAS